MILELILCCLVQFSLFRLGSVMCFGVSAGKV
uniref:Uncharacterized protein n=1 Tax=Arundo donax TaxID=35708 RepID=A0A0A9HAF3_ARUDO